MYLFFDTETTGLPAKGQYDNPYHPECPRLVELAAVLFGLDYKPIATLEAIVKPNGFIIPENAARVHKITTEIALDKGRPLDEVLQEFESMRGVSKVLIAHNIQFDWLILRREYEEFGGMTPATMVMERYCTKNALTDVCKIPGFRGSYKWPTLTEAYSCLFNDSFYGAHGALADVMACARVYFAHEHKIDIGKYIPPQQELAV